MGWIAILEPGQAIRATDLSEATGIPAHYLSKILRRLVVAKLLLSQKGRGGGFSLSRPPERITFFQVLAAVDAAPEDGPCAFGWGQCSSEHPCPMHDAWSEISGAFYTWAIKTTLADVSSVDATTIRMRRPD